MFWHSVILGFNVLLHWETWVAVLASTLVSTGLSGASKRLLHSEKFATLGCFSLVLSGLIETLMLSSVIVFLLPVFFGANYTDAYFHLFNAVKFLKIVGGLTVLYTLLSFIPVIGPMLVQHYTVATYSLGVIFVRLCLWYSDTNTHSLIATAPWWSAVLYGCLAVLINVVALGSVLHLQRVFDKIFARFIQGGYVYFMKSLTGPEITWRSEATSVLIAKFAALVGVGMYSHYCLLL